MNSDTAVSQLEAKPGWRVFMENVARQVEDMIKTEDMPGSLEWQIVSLMPNLQCVELKYSDVDDGFESPTFQMFIPKRYYGMSMVKLINKQTGEEYHLQAHPRLILATISF